MLTTRKMLSKMHFTIKECRHFISEFYGDYTDSQNFSNIIFGIDHSELNAAMLPGKKPNKRGIFNRIIFQESLFSFALFPGTVLELQAHFRKTNPATSDSIQAKINELDACLGRFNKNESEFVAFFKENIDVFVNKLGVILESLANPGNTYSNQYILNLLKQKKLHAPLFSTKVSFKRLFFNMEKLQFFHEEINRQRPNRSKSNSKDFLNFLIIDALNSDPNCHIIYFSKDPTVRSVNDLVGHKFGKGIPIRGIRYLKYTNKILKRYDSLKSVNGQHLENAMQKADKIIYLISQSLGYEKHTEDYVNELLLSNPNELIKLPDELVEDLLYFENHIYKKMFKSNANDWSIDDMAKLLYKQYENGAIKLENLNKVWPQWSADKNLLENELNNILKLWNKYSFDSFESILTEIENKQKRKNDKEDEDDEY